MTDKEIIQALDLCCTQQNGGLMPCYGCPCWNHDEQECEGIDYDVTFDLINRQRAEIERLKSANAEKFRQWDMLAEKTKQHYSDLYNEAKDRLKAEAYKEFANQIKMHKRRMRGFDLCNEFWDYAVLVEDIDNILKTMVGEEE